LTSTAPSTIVFTMTDHAPDDQEYTAEEVLAIEAAERRECEELAEQRRHLDDLYDQEREKRGLARE
jgi:hypothetical protein